MFNCKKLFKLQIRPPSLILLFTTSQDRWIFPSQSWEVINSMMMMMMIIIIVSKQVPVTQIIPFLLHTFCISCCLVSLVSAWICTANVQDQETWESFQQPLLSDLNAHALASRCYHSPGTDLPSNVSHGTLIVNLTASCIEGRQCLELKHTEKQLLLVWFKTPT